MCLVYVFRSRENAISWQYIVDSRRTGNVVSLPRRTFSAAYCKITLMFISLSYLDILMSVSENGERERGLLLSFLHAASTHQRHGAAQR